MSTSGHPSRARLGNNLQQIKLISDPPKTIIKLIKGIKCEKNKKL